VVRVDEDALLGLALATDGNGRYARLDPYAGAQLALSEAYRNVAVSGARPLAVTNCLNFGSPEDPAVMWQFAEAVRGLADGGLELGIPVTGGNVSFYNQTGDTAILPTPVVGVLGVLADVTRRTPLRVPTDGPYVLLLLGDTREDLGGSAWAGEVHGHLGGLPPAPDLAAERALAQALGDGSDRGLLAAAHDISDGGLAQCLVELLLASGVGAELALPEGDDPFTTLFSETVARAVVAVAAGDVSTYEDLCRDAGVPVARLGETGGDRLVLRDLFALPLDELRIAHEGTLPALFA
jgi:phosphoribosylformylglycinamidine synthase